MPFDQKNLGDQKLKGFEESVRVYTVELKEDTELPEPTTLAGSEKSLTNRWLKITSTIALTVGVGLLAWFQPWAPKYDPSSEVELGLSLPDNPSLAVLPFSNMSDDPSQIYFSDGISEDIITGLSQLKNLIVISRNSSFTFRNTSAKVQDIGKDLGAKYLLEGSVRKSGTQIRITAQLIDTNSGHQLWAEKYDRELTDIFAVQDEITERIVSILSIQLSGDEQQQISNSATKSFDAYDLFLQARISSSSRTEQGMTQAAEILRQAISVDPGFARAYGALAVALTRLANAGYSDSPAEMKERSLELAIRADAMNPNSPQVQWSLGFIYLYRNQFEEAVEALERAISLSPSYADAYALLALIKNEMGLAEEAIRLIEKGMNLNPHYSWDYLYNLGRANYALGRYERAVEYLQQALERNEVVGQSRLFLAASFVQLGQLDDAEWEVEQVQMAFPAFTLSHLRTIFPITDRELLEKFVTDLTAAGLPE
jgi:TolB-like protein/Flp pilus assembly protein TadD